jgi:hypothetical protein
VIHDHQESIGGDGFERLMPLNKNLLRNEVYLLKKKRPFTFFFLHCHTCVWSMELDVIVFNLLVVKNVEVYKNNP